MSLLGHDDVALWNVFGNLMDLRSFRLM